MKRDFSYRRYKDKAIVDREAAKSVSSQFEKRRREVKEERKKRLQERKVKILKNFYITEETVLKTDNKYDQQTKSLFNFRQKVETLVKSIKGNKGIKKVIETLMPSFACKGQSIVKPTEQQILQVSTAFKITLEEAEKSLNLSKELEWMDKVI